MSAGRIRKRENPFSQISNVLIRDKTISLKAKGLYALIESYLNIPDFVLYKDMLCSYCLEGQGAFDNAWNELKKAGYLIQHKMKGEKGTFVYEYELLEVPESTPQKSTPGQSSPGKTKSESSKHGKSEPLNINSEEIKKDKEYLLNNNTISDDVVQRKMNAEDVSAYFDKIKIWFNEYVKYEPDKLLTLKEILTDLFYKIPKDAAEKVKNFNREDALKFFGMVMDVYYSDNGNKYSDPVINKEGYLVGILRNF